LPVITTTIQTQAFRHSSRGINTAESTAEMTRHWAHSYSYSRIVLRSVFGYSSWQV